MACCFFSADGGEAKEERLSLVLGKCWVFDLGRSSSSSRLPSWFGGGRCHATLAAACCCWWVYTHYRLQCRQGLLAPSVCLCVFCLLKARTHHSALLLSLPSSFPLLSCLSRPPLLEP